MSHLCRLRQDDKKNDDDDQGDSDITDTDTPTDQDTTVQPLTVAELCQLYATSYNSTHDDRHCGTTAFETDSATQSRLCAPDGAGTKWATRLLESSSANRITIDWSRARQCNQQARALRSANTPIELARNSEWQALLSGACGTFFTANVATNGACTYVWDCKNAGDYCSTDAPYETPNFTCKPRRNVGEDCDAAFNPCVVGLTCSIAEQKCVADTVPCSSNEECASGSCLSGSCVAAASVDPGGACRTDGDCKQPCSVCNQHGAEAAATCKPIGSTNAACEVRSDCADDLGCTDGVCKTLPEGSDCNHSDDRCASSTQCLQPVQCATMGEPDCNANAPYCSWNGSACLYADGKCTTPPSSGACLPTYSGQRCAPPTECVTGDNTCRLPASLGDPCDPALVTAPPCGNNLTCITGFCLASCGGDFACGASEYCDQQVYPATCTPWVTDVCTQTNACGPQKYCPEVSEACGRNLDTTTCAADAACVWNVDRCEAGPGPTDRHCVELLPPGELAYGPCATLPGTGKFGQNPSCDTNYCARIDDYNATCVVQPRGCMNGYGDGDYDGGFLALPFIFGLVRWNRRRKR